MLVNRITRATKSWFSSIECY